MAFFNSKEFENLKKENEELKKQLNIFIEQKDISADTEEIRKRLRIEIADLNEQKNDTLTEIQILNNDRKIMESELKELANKIPELTGLKNELQQNLIDYTSQIEILKKEIENGRQNTSDTSINTVESSTKLKILQRENDEQRNEILLLNNKVENLLSQVEKLEDELKLDKEGKINDEEKILAELREREVRFLRGIENKKAEATALIKKVRVLKEKDTVERNNLKDIYKRIEVMKRERDYYSKEEVRILNNLARLKEKEDTLSNNVSHKELEMKAQDEILNMLTKNITNKQGKEAELDNDLRELDSELKKRTDEISKALDDNNKISEENNSGQKKLNDVNNELATKSRRLPELTGELVFLEQKLSELEKEIEKSESIKKELNQKVSEQAEIYEKLKEQSDLMRQTLPLLEKKKADIEKENTALEERFGKLFQKYSYDVNELSRKRILYEKLVMDKEKEINEKDQILFEKIAALEESERVLGLRQAEINSLQGILKVLDEQKETLRKDLNSLEEKTTEVLRRNDGLRMETEYLMSKKQSIEDNMKEIINDMSDRFEKTRSKKHEIDEELAEYEDRLHLTRERISESVKELSDLQTSIGQIKLEHEEQRGYITKLVAKKTKLLEEISRGQVLLQKYDQIKEKVKIEKAAASGKKEGGIFPAEEYLNELKNGRQRDQSIEE